MNPFFLPTLKKHLETDLAPLSLVGRGKGDVPDTVRPVRVFIGDLPPKKPGGIPAELPGAHFPCVVLVPGGGFQHEGEAVVTVGAICAVYSPENGDAEGAENELTLLLSGVAKSLWPCRSAPLDRRYRLCADTAGRYFGWERAEGQPRPYAQATIVSLWRMKGLE